MLVSMRLVVLRKDGEEKYLRTNFFLENLAPPPTCRGAGEPSCRLVIPVSYHPCVVQGLFPALGKQTDFGNY